MKTNDLFQRIFIVFFSDWAFGDSANCVMNQKSLRRNSNWQRSRPKVMGALAPPQGPSFPLEDENPRRGVVGPIMNTGESETEGKRRGETKRGDMFWASFSDSGRGGFGRDTPKKGREYPPPGHKKKRAKKMHPQNGLQKYFSDLRPDPKEPGVPPPLWVQPDTPYGGRSPRWGRGLVLRLVWG